MKTIKFEFEKATKNTFRFTEVSKSPIIGTLYVQKAAFSGKQPSAITVTVTAA